MNETRLVLTILAGVVALFLFTTGRVGSGMMDDGPIGGGGGTTRYVASRSRRLTKDASPEEQIQRLEDAVAALEATSKNQQIEIAKAVKELTAAKASVDRAVVLQRKAANLLIRTIGQKQSGPQGLAEPAANPQHAAGVAASVPEPPFAHGMYVGDNKVLCYVSVGGYVRRMYAFASDRGMMPHLCFNEGWEQEFAQVIERIPLGKNQRIVEFGANIGYFSLSMGMRASIVGAGPVTVVEGSPSTYELLFSSVALNGLTNVNAENAVLVEDPDQKEAEFCVRPAHPMNNYIITPKTRCASSREGDPEEYKSMSVPARTTDSFFPKNVPLSAYAYVKIDVDFAEGLAWRRLAHMMKERSELLPLVTVEVNPVRNTEGVLESMAGLYKKLRRIEGTACPVRALDDPVWKVPGDHLVLLIAPTNTASHPCV